MRSKLEYDFNKEWAKSVSKEDFVKVHEHLKDKIDLGKVWEDLQDKKPAEQPKK